jgi:hypothetical protein
MLRSPLGRGRRFWLRQDLSAMRAPRRPQPSQHVLQRHPNKTGRHKGQPERWRAPTLRCGHSNRLKGHVQFGGETTGAELHQQGLKRLADVSLLLGRDASGVLLGRPFPLPDCPLCEDRHAGKVAVAPGAFSNPATTRYRNRESTIESSPNLLPPSFRHCVSNSRARQSILRRSWNRPSRNIASLIRPAGLKPARAYALDARSLAANTVR